MGQSRVRAEVAIQTALKYFWKDPSKLTESEKLAMTLMTEISRLEEGIVEVLEDKKPSREKLVALLYRDRERDK
jgi:hypothetical protein